MAELKGALPLTFVRKMEAMLGEEAQAFLESYQHPRTYGLRINSHKLPFDSAMRTKITEQFGLHPVPWCRSGYYYDEHTRPGKHPYHAAGLYYIQEPSAMSAVELLDPQPGDCVLDLASAPGGKATQIADKLLGQGLLIANEIHPSRAKILSENIERMGISNAVVTCSSPDELAKRFAGFFDRIMLDAPCSGEGMFRKDENAILEWSLDHVAMCASRQRAIVQEAVRMLKPGGTLAYSTCTFNREENEKIIEWLLEKEPGFELLGMERIWPHLQQGEGHFVAVLRRKLTGEDVPESDRTRSHSSNAKDKGQRIIIEQFRSFVDQTLPGLVLPAGEFVSFGEQLYVLPSLNGTFQAQHLQGIRTLRPGLHLGQFKKNRFEPAHALALSLTAVEESWMTCDLEGDSAQIIAYLRGETLAVPANLKGWTIVTVDGYPIGWGKCSGGQLKNHYPKGLRRLG